MKTYQHPVFGNQEVNDEEHIPEGYVKCDGCGIYSPFTHGCDNTGNKCPSCYDDKHLAEKHSPTTDNMRTFILKKDLPDVKAGAEFVLGKATDAYYLSAYKTGTKYNCYTYPKDYVEQNKEWFSEKVQKPPLGIIPFWLHNEIRLRNINEAIERYRMGGYDIPKEWIAEKETLDGWAQCRAREAFIM